ncbi:MAG: xanthine dehydrogenase family protein subunit M [Deltaproteobacteria bacterium]|nr:xanthine dehydrogenase family protein subunit M [Deltaproteobacteria bacterium]
MSLPKLEYCQARTIEEALNMWAEKTAARYIAGGTDLLPQLRAGSRAPLRVVDLKYIENLAKIRQVEDGSVSIGAAASVAQVAADASVRQHYPILVDCCLSLGSYPLRNRATVVGNICNASPCADTSAALLALEAVVVTAGPKAKRRIPIGDFFKGPGESCLQAGELVVEIILPKATSGGRGHYGRIARRKSVDISTVAVLVSVLPKGQPRHRLSLLSVAPTPLRVFEAEAVLDERGPEGASQAAEIARASCTPINDVRGSAEYRWDMVGVLTERGVMTLAESIGR